MKKRYLIISLGIITFIILGIIIFKFFINSMDNDFGNYSTMCDEIGLDIPDNVKIKTLVDTVGFHGDGDCSYKISLSEEQYQLIVKQIKKSSWNEGKLSKEVDILLYGGKTKGIEYELNFGDKANIPKIDNGYWKMINHNSGSLLDNSNNFTYGVLDKENKILYMYQHNS